MDEKKNNFVLGLKPGDLFEVVHPFHAINKTSSDPKDIMSGNFHFTLFPMKKGAIGMVTDVIAPQLNIDYPLAAVTQITCLLKKDIVSFTMSDKQIKKNICKKK